MGMCAVYLFDTIWRVVSTLKRRRFFKICEHYNEDKGASLIRFGVLYNEDKGELL